jgi:hypothetical protein
MPKIMAVGCVVQKRSAARRLQALTSIFATRLRLWNAGHSPTAGAYVSDPQWRKSGFSCRRRGDRIETRSFSPATRSKAALALPPLPSARVLARWPVERTATAKATFGGRLRRACSWTLARWSDGGASVAGPGLRCGPNATLLLHAQGARAPVEGFDWS